MVVEVHVDRLGHRRIPCEEFGFPAIVDDEGRFFNFGIWYRDVLEFTLGKNRRLSQAKRLDQAQREPSGFGGSSSKNVEDRHGIDFKTGRSKAGTLAGCK